jgi:hypothetical protein
VSVIHKYQREGRKIWAELSSLCCGYCSYVTTMAGDTCHSSGFLLLHPDRDLQPMTAPGPWQWPELSMGDFCPLSYGGQSGYGGCSYVSFPSVAHNGVASQAYFTTEAPSRS